MTVAFFAAIGLPGLSEFVSELLSYLGAFQTFRWVAILSSLGIVLTAGYMLWTLQRIFLGQLPDKWKSLTDVNGRELVAFVPLIVVIVVLGIFPSIMLHPINASVNHLVDFVHKFGSGLAAAR
jgi:NADH-quinone oxidoreductase subunit M